VEVTIRTSAPPTTQRILLNSPDVSTAVVPEEICVSARQELKELRDDSNVEFKESIFVMNVDRDDASLYPPMIPTLERVPRIDEFTRARPAAIVEFVDT
jgi:hypothetical protein